MTIRRLLTLLMAIVAALAAEGGAATARDIVNAALKTPSIDLIPVLEAVETDKAQVAIEIPDARAQKSLMTLEAKGPGPLHRWVVFSLLNPDGVPHDLVIVSPHQGFVGSGFFWPKREGSRLYGFQNSATSEAVPLRALGMDALAFRIPPNTSETFALELAPSGLGSLSLWQRNAFEAQAGEYAFFRGVVLGIAMLLGVAIASFFIVRQQAVFLAATLFAWASVLFLSVEAGYLPDIQRWLGLGPGDGPKFRALVESMMLAGVILCLSTFLELRKRMPILGNIFLLCAALTAALAAYGWFEPTIASGVARLAFGFFVLFGYVLIFTLWREGGIRARASILTWTVLLAWTAMAAFGALDIIPSPNTRLVISAGLALVLLTMGFTLAQFAFSHGILSSRFFEDSGRRALALAGSEQTVWDWQPERGTLYVGPELERALGLEPGLLMSRGLKAWIDLIHPADRSAYVASVEAAERRGRGTFSQEFRLRRNDGAYRWYLLRARSMIGQDGRASRCIGTLADITGMKRSEERLLSDAVRDRITGLPNRALFVDRLEFAMRRAHLENNRELYVLVIDLDRFKTVNDGLGHEVGDSLLSVTGRRLLTLMGPEDTLARLPGDQFAVIFNGRKPKRDVIPFAEQIRTTLSRPIKLRGRELFLTASFGVARFLDDRSSPQDFVKDAEIALYEAKRRGRDSIEFFRPDMRDERTELLALEQDLRRAIERNEIEVVYQPISRLSDMQLSGFEALVRWRHRTEGLLGPESFMSLAEETGIIKDLSHYVLNEAARQLGIWQRAFRPDKPLFVSVNMSSSQLLNTDLVDDVRALLGREDISAGTLKLELTESLIMENPELSAEILERFKALGVGLACDDFGTGYSALASLRRLPFDILKIDKSFLDADLEDEKAMIILETIILLAHDLNMTVVAEGIESQEQIAALAELECDLGQGFLIGEPMTAKQVVEALGGGSFAGPKPVFGSLWSRLGGRRPAEISAPVPSGGLAQSRPAEQPVLPALETVQAALYGATQALALQKREPAAQGNGPPPPEAAEIEAASAEALAPPVEILPATEDAQPGPAHHDPEPLPPPPPPPRPAERPRLSAPTLVAIGPKPGTAPLVPRAGRPVMAPIPVVPRGPQSRPKLAESAEPREEPRHQPELTPKASAAETTGGALELPLDVQSPSQVELPQQATESEIETQAATGSGEAPDQDLGDGRPMKQMPPHPADEQADTTPASETAAPSSEEPSPLRESAAEPSLSGASESSEPATSDQRADETAAAEAGTEVPAAAEQASERDGSQSSEPRIEEERPQMLRRQRRKSKAAKLT